MSKQLHHVMLPGEGEFREVVDLQVRSALPKKPLVLENKTITIGSTYEEATVSANRLLSQMEFDVHAGDVFSVPAEYTMRIVCFKNYTVQAFLDWASTQTITEAHEASYDTLRLQIAKKVASGNHASSANISPDEVQPTVPVDVWTGLNELASVEDVDDLASAVNKAAMVTTGADEPDLDVTDDSGNVLMRLANGGVETKSFRSFDCVTYASPTATYNGAALTLTVAHTFRKGDRVVIHMERGAMPWDYGAYVSYYENDTAIRANWRGDCAWIEHTVKADTATISAAYAASAVGMTSGTVRLEVSLLGNTPVKPTIVTVKKDGSGDYTTLRGAIDAIGTKANDVLNPYRIEVYPGVYDVMDDYTDEEIAAAAYDQTSFVGPKLLNGMYLVGIGNPGEVVLNGELSDSDWTGTIRGVVSTLNTQGSCGMENLTVIARNLRYCVHADYHTPIMKKPKQVVKDCIFRGYNISYNPGTTFGAGTSDSGCDYDFINCDFGENGGVHTLSSTKARSYIHCVNCKGHGFRIGDQETSSPVDGYSMYTFDNCDFLWINYAMAGSVPHAKVRGCGGRSPLYQFPAAVLYDTGDVVAMRNSGFSSTLSVGKAAEWFSNVEHGPRFQPATSAARVVGICVYKDDDDTYIQTKGYVRADRTSLTGYSIGDYIGLSSGNLAIVSDAAQAFGRIAYVDNSGVGYIKLGGV